VPQPYRLAASSGRGNLKTVIVDNDTLCTTFTPGDTDTAVVTFSGVGLAVGDTPQEEFVKTQEGAVHAQFFVIDKVRSWYNATAPEIVSHLTPLLLDYRKVVTLGNSMGGFGAAYFASRLPNCRAAISFVPQFSVRRTLVPKEKRWREFRSKIGPWTVQHAMEQANDDPELLLFFGAQEPRDLEHLALYQQHATRRTSIFLLAEPRHGAARYLKNRGHLRALLDAVILRDEGAGGVERLLNSHQVPHTFWTGSAASQQ
jgi:pimeloyl-ACP methyl ester carboxylesterase